MFFLRTLAVADFTSNIIYVVELILFGETVEVTVCENVQLIFPLHV